MRENEAEDARCLARVEELLVQSSADGALGGFRKSKSCQKHLQLFTGLQNYVLMTVRTEKTMKN